MMRNFYTLLLISILSFDLSSLLSQTIVPSGAVSGTWAPSGSPYNVTGNIYVMPDSTLTIQPGVTVNFQGYYKFYVLGSLKALGTQLDTIVFTAQNPATGWGGIRYDGISANQDSSLFVYCRVSNGKAAGTSNDKNGGGFFFSSFSKARIQHSLISSCNAVERGGGIYCNYSGILILENTISNNAASDPTTSEGGGIYMSGTLPVFSHNVLSSNTAGFAGGGMCVKGNGVLSNNTVINNSCSGTGGGIFLDGSGSMMIKNSIISNNSAGGGGGIYFNNGSCSALNNVISFNNSPGGSGGGILVFSPGNTCNISNNFICNNASNSGAGIFVNTFSTLSNNLIANNTAQTYGAGVYLAGGSNNSTLINCTIVNCNTSNSVGGGGGVFCEGSSPIFKNSIIFGNTSSTLNGSNIYIFDNGSDPQFTYCNIQGGTAGFYLNPSNGLNIYSGVYNNNINVSPLFVSPTAGSGTSFNGLTADWKLQNSSPCIDAGDPTTITPVTDLAGNPRVTPCRVDVGAYENQYLPPITLSVITQNIFCNGGTGSATAVVSNGTSPYTYNWSNGQTTSIATGLIAGSYTVNVTDNSGCLITSSITITQPATISVSASSTPSNCYSNIGTVNLSTIGGTSPYSYLWSNSQTSPAISGLPAGNYSVTVTDSNGCTTTTNTTVNYTLPNTPSICVVTVDSISKFNIISWDKTGYNVSDTFVVYRDISNNNYQRIGAVSFGSLSQFVDTAATLFAANGDPNVSSWRYKLSVKDSCGNESAKSPYHQTIFIQNSGANFIWNHYQIQGQGVPVPALQNYVIYRDDFSNGNWQPIQTLSASSTAFTDPNFAIFQNIASYRVETVWNISCDPSRGIINTTRSNIKNVAAPLSNGFANESLNRIAIFPNPAKNKFTAELIVKENTKAIIKLLDVQGREVLLTNRVLSSGKNLETVNVDELSPGVYFIQFQLGEQLQRVKLVKED